MSESQVLPKPKPNDEESLPSPQRSEPPVDPSAGDGAFRLTVRKLQLPVRPRGVLAD